MTAPVHHCSEAAVLQASAALPGTLGCIELGCPQILLGAVWIGASCMDWVLYGWEVSKCSCVPYGLEVSRLKLVGRYELHEASPAFLCGTCEVGAGPTSVSSGAVFISNHGIPPEGFIPCQGHGMYTTPATKCCCLTIAGGVPRGIGALGTQLRKPSVPFRTSTLWVRAPDKTSGSAWPRWQDVLSCHPFGKFVQSVWVLHCACLKRK